MIRTNIINRIANTDYVRSALNDKADLCAFKEKPSFRIIMGVSAILFSYIISWPAIAALGACLHRTRALEYCSVRRGKDLTV